MASSLMNLAGRITRRQKGFTLIEMIVVVGIIAVLATVIIPNLGKFIGSGESGAKSAEQESVETAMTAMMVDKTGKMQIFHIIGELLLECERQGGQQAWTPLDRNVSARGQNTGRGHEYDNAAVLHDSCRFLKSACAWRADPGAIAIDYDPVDRTITIRVESYYKILRHNQVVPRLRRIGVASPCGLRSNKLK